MLFKNDAVIALTHSIRGQEDIIKVSQQAGFTTICWENHYTTWEGRQESIVYMDSHTCMQTHTDRYTHTKCMRWKWLITPHLFHHRDTFRLISSHSHTHTLVCLRKQTVLHCLFMNSSVCCRQGGDEDIYCVLRYGHVFNIINLLSNFPLALPTHLVQPSHSIS